MVGSAIVASRFVLVQTDPLSLALLRYFIGFCCLLPPLLLAARTRFDGRDIVPLGLLGITQFGILVVLLNYSLEFIPSARAALIFATFPLLTLIIAAALGRERLTWPKLLGVSATLVGVALALGPGAGNPGSSAGAWIGALAAFASALSGAVCSVLYRPYLQKYPTLAVSALAMAASVLFLAVLALVRGSWHSLAHIDPAGWLAVGFIGLSSGIGYYLWLWALNHTTPTRVTVFLALSPATATGLGALWLGERVTSAFLLGLLCVIAGLWLAYRQPHHGDSA